MGRTGRYPQLARFDGPPRSDRRGNLLLTRRRTRVLSVFIPAHGEQVDPRVCAMGGDPHDVRLIPSQPGIDIDGIRLCAAAWVCTKGQLPPPPHPYT
jgi:hypothetical protein